MYLAKKIEADTGPACEVTRTDSELPNAMGGGGSPGPAHARKETTGQENDDGVKLTWTGVEISGP